MDVFCMFVCVCVCAYVRIFCALVVGLNTGHAFRQQKTFYKFLSIILNQHTHIVGAPFCSLTLSHASVALVTHTLPPLCPELPVPRGLRLRDGVPVPLRGAGLGPAVGQHPEQPAGGGLLLLHDLRGHDDAGRRAVRCAGLVPRQRLPRSRIFVFMH